VVIDTSAVLAKRYLQPAWQPAAVVLADIGLDGQRLQQIRVNFAHFSIRATPQFGGSMRSHKFRPIADRVSDMIQGGSIHEWRRSYRLVSAIAKTGRSCWP